MNRRIVSAAIALLLCAAFLMPFAPTTAYAWSADSVTYANSDPQKYTIVVDLTNKIVTIYEREGGNAYGSIARQSLCTIGAKDTETPTGSWRLNARRRRFGYFSEFDVYAQYWVNVIGGIYFHSILYTQPVEGYFTRTSFNNLGRASSHGCIRMLVEEVRWMYYNCPPGTLVVVTNNKAANPELIESLKPKISARDYKPEPDEYEAAKLAAPKGVARRGSVLQDSRGNFVASIEKGEHFDIILSGYPKTKIRLSTGETGLLDNDRILFLDNSPETTVKVLSAKSNIYARPSNVDDPVTTLEAGTEVVILESTKYFHRIDASGTGGYVLKSKVQSKSLAHDGEDIEALLDGDEDSEEISFSITRVHSEYGNLYNSPSNRYDPIAIFGEGTDLIVLGSTENFLKVSVGEHTGYILKRDCRSVIVTQNGSEKYSLQVFELEPVELNESAPPEDEV